MVPSISEPVTGYLHWKKTTFFAIDVLSVNKTDIYRHDITPLFLLTNVVCFNI